MGNNQGLVRLQLLAEADNIAASRFYDRAGWQKTGLICRRKMLNKPELNFVNSYSNRFGG